jgi:hypothetical protein
MRLRLLAICALLFAFELAFLPRPGIMEDEALFAAPFLRNLPALYSWQIGALHVPVMSMSYLGAFKSWLYWPVFHLWPPGVWSMRLPVCILSLVTLWLFADLVRCVTDSGTATAAALFLATDAMFVLIDVFDMTVCLLLLGMVAFLNLLHRKHFPAAFFVAGISLWYKANFIFPLAGVALGFALIYPGPVRRFLSARNVLLAVIAFGIGAAPLIEFNLRQAGATFRASGELPTVPPAEKLMMLRRTLDGRAFEHYMFRSASAENLPLQGAELGDLVLAWYRSSNFHPGSLLLPALVLALLALPFLGNSPFLRPLLFAWVAFAATFGFMFVLRDAGAGPHHTVLLYPAPHFIVAATGAALCRKLAMAWRAPAFAALAVLVAGSGLWLLGQYYRAARENGFSVFWNDGLPNLAEAVRSEALPVSLLDWGIHNGLQIETRDRIVIDEDIQPRENVLYVGHCDGYIVDESRWKRFQDLSKTAPFRLLWKRVIPDREGQPVFCLFRLTR